MYSKKYNHIDNRHKSELLLNPNTHPLRCVLLIRILLQAIQPIQPMVINIIDTDNQGIYESICSSTRVL